MANFDPNSWYQVLVTSAAKSQSMEGTQLYDHGKGAVFFKTTNTTDDAQQWQIFPYNSTYYVLRTKASGAQGYMNVAVSTTEDTPGRTVPTLRNSTLSDDSMFWSISPWGDGTFKFSNAANGSSWQMDVKGNSLMAMTSNISVQQDGQSFSFSQLGNINNAKYSSVILPSATATSTSTSSTTTSTSTSTSTSPPKSSSGLSASAKSAIGGSIGAVVLVALIILGIVLYKRRQRAHASQAAPPYHLVEQPQDAVWDGNGYKDPSDIKRPVEVEAVRPVAELHSQFLGPQELPGNMRR